MTFSDALRRYSGRSSPLSDPMDPFGGAGSFSQTHNALRNIISPVPQSSLFGGAGLFSSTARVRGPNTGGADIVPGPLGIWEEDRGREHQQIGKFGVNLLGEGQSFAPGATQPTSRPPDVAGQLRAMADPNNPENRGFFEGLIGGLFGLSGQQGVKDFGSFVGSGLDLPLELLGNVGGAALAPFTVPSELMDQANWDRDVVEAYRAAAEENPINGILLWSQAAKAQWNRDHAEGEHAGRGLMSDIGPAVALTDQLGWLMQTVFGVPGRGVQRLIAGDTGQTTNVAAVEAAVQSGDLTSIKDEAWLQIAEQAQRGDFGPLGQERTRELMVDAAVTMGATTPGRSATVVDESAIGPITRQGVRDILYNLGTDPWLIAGGLIGAGRTVAKHGAQVAATKYWQAFPREMVDDVLADVEAVAMRETGFSDPARAWAAMGREPAGLRRTLEAGDEVGRAAGRGARADSGLEYRVLSEVAQMPKYAAHRDGAMDALNYIQRWRSTWEPALRPIANTVININDPFRLLGGKAGAGATARTSMERQADTVFSTNMTEGLIRGQGSLDAHAEVQGALRGSARAAYDRGLGVYAANFARAFMRNGLIRDLRRRSRMGDDTFFGMFRHNPEEVITSRALGARGTDIATAVEKQALRFRPLYLATERGGSEAALARGRQEVARRLEVMGMSADEAAQTVAGMNRDNLSMLDGAYFGFAVDAFTQARQKAIDAVPSTGVPKGALDPERLTVLGPRQMTEQIAKDVLAAIDSGDMVAVREALVRYDILFENFTESISDADLARAVRELLTDQIDAGALPRDLDSLAGLSDEMRAWAEQNADLGYRPGFRPEADNLWRATFDEDGKIVGINPWVDLVGTAADVPTYNRWQLAKDMLFHNIRGERIMADARVRLAEYVSENWGVPRAQSDALFARFLRTAQEAGITPRGMTAEQVYRIVQTQGLDTEAMAGIGVRQAVDALLTAFEGKFRHVGATQKFTGAAKTQLGGQSNWLGQVAEKIYPAVRFTLNPLFQAQELTEPYILNIMRGVKPGWTASELDEKTLGLIEYLIRDNKYAFDDQIEFGATLLWGADSAKQAFGDTTKLGKAVRLLTLNGRLNVKEVKRVNYARATRRQLGHEFREAMERVSPEVARRLRAHYQTGDWGEIAVRYLTEKARLETPTGVLKPDWFGARRAVELDKVVRVFDDIADADALRSAVRNGDMDEAAFRDTLIDAGADPDFAERAWMTAAARFTPDEWWDEWRTNFRAGNQRATDFDRTLVKSVADTLGMSEEEYLARYLADVPMSADARALAALSPREKRFIQLMAEVTDDIDGPARTQATDAVIERFRREFRFSDRENFSIIDDDGTVVASGSQMRPWTVRKDAATVDAHLGIEIDPYLPEAMGRTLVHNHPSHNPFSPADMVTAAEHGVKEMVVTSPGITYSLRAPGGWLTDEFTDMFGLPPDADSFGDDVFAAMRAREDYWTDVRNAFNAMWQNKARQVYNELRDNPFYASRNGDYFDLYLDAVATNAAVMSLADRFGWSFKSVDHFGLPVDPLERHRMLAEFADNPPVHLKRDLPYTYTSEPLEAVDMAGRGTMVSYEYASRHRPWVPEGLSDEVQRQVMDGFEDWARSVLAPKFGTAIASVTRGRGGWMDPNAGFSDTVNAVMDVFGTGEQAEDFAAALGYLLRQDAVVTSRVKAGRNVADTSAGEKWAWEFIAPRELDGDEASALARTIAEALPSVGELGSSIVRTADGRTGIRFVDYMGEGVIDEQTFLASIDDAGREALGDALERNGFDGVLAQHEVVDFRYIDNDWDEAAQNGEGYLQRLSARRPDLAKQLAGGLRREADDRLAGLLRQHAPAEFDAHVAALRARGESVPNFRVPGQYESIPEGVVVSIPGGRASLNQPDRQFTLWEQQILKAQRINAEALFNADPDLYVKMMQAIWKGKWHNIEDDPMARYNVLSFAALTPNSALDVSEGAHALVRATTGQGVGRGVLGMMVRARRIIGKLPEEFRSDPSAIGIMFQLDEGLRVDGYRLFKASWLTPEERTLADNVVSRIDRRMRDLPPEDRARWARRIQARLDGGRRRSGRGRGSRVPGLNRGNLRIQVHPFPTGHPQIGSPTFVTVAKPNVRFRGNATNTQWGTVLRWLDSGAFTSDNPAVQRFMRPQANESRAQWALRMTSILPGLDMKTAMMAAQAGGPSAASHGALDTHILRYIVQMAQKRGDLDGAAKVVVPPAPGTTPVPPGYIRAYHYTRDIDAVEAQGLDVAFAKGSTYGEPNAIWFSASKPNEDSVNFVEVFIRADEIDTIGKVDQSDLDDMMARGSNFMVRTEKIEPERFVTVSRPRQNRLRYISETYPPGSPEAKQWIEEGGPAFARTIDEDYAWAIDQWEAMGQPGLLDRVSPRYATHLREEVGRAADASSTAFKSPEGDRVFLIPENNPLRKAPWSPEKERYMRSRLAELIPDPEERALYDDPEILRLMSETGGKINRWGGDYAVLDDYLNTVLKADEVARLRADGFNDAADAIERMTGGQYQWLVWDRVRSGAGVPLDPHVSLTRGGNLTSPRVGAELDRHLQVQRMGSPYDPTNSMLWQQVDGQILGANQIQADGRRMLLATQHADARTGLHELAHLFEQHLDPSLREKVLQAFREATGSSRRTWNRDVSEWWADSFLDFVKSGKRPGNRGLRSSFDYFRRTVTGVEATVKANAERRVLEQQKTRAVNRATKAVERTAAPAREAEKALKAARQAAQRETRELRRARARVGLDALEQRRNVAREEVLRDENLLKEAKANVRRLKAEIRQAEARARAAAGTPSAGGLTAGVSRKRARLAATEAQISDMEKALRKTRDRLTKANREVGAARRRTPLEQFEQRRDAARSAVDKALDAQRRAKAAHDDAQKALRQAKGLSVRPAKAKVTPPPLSDEMQEVFNQITRAPKADPTVGRIPESGAPYDVQEEATYQAAALALSRAEENAFTMHYYKRGRNLIERSVNHPYFGLYPASYMWGKILPEMLRFLIKQPFGIDAPLGGLALSNNLYRSVMVQQQYDEEFREQMVERTDMFHLLALMTPSLPWEVPVNAPLWMRRISEASLTQSEKLAAGEEAPIMGTEQLGRTTREVLNYAFGPAAAAQNIGSGLASAFGFASESLQAASSTVNNILAGTPEQIGATPVAPSGTVPSVPGAPATLPPSEVEAGPLGP